jgi:uracil-DNA glycosylase
MSARVDRGYVDEPFATLVVEYPGVDVYPARDFRVEWGPVFHRGRLDGSAKVLVIGQDPGQHENVVRRALVGQAGQRLQGFLARLGIVHSYVMINVFLYSVYGQPAANRHRHNSEIAAYRHRWLDALVAPGQIRVVLLLGSLANSAYQTWRQTPAGAAAQLRARSIRHPTYPEGASRGGGKTKAEAMLELTSDWNRALAELRPLISEPDVPIPATLYSRALTLADNVPIPAEDLPVGLPAWMRSLNSWVVRAGNTPDEKRATLVLRVPARHRPWR